MIGFMPGGELFAAMLVWIIDPNLERTTAHCELGYDLDSWWHGYTNCSWRSLCMYSALPAFLFLVLALVLLPESPHFLAARGRETQPLVHPGRAASGKAAEEAGALATMTSGKFLATSCFMCLAHFTKDFSLFGLAYVFPQYFKGNRHGTVAQHLIITALLALPGVAIAIIVMRLPSVGHITAMRTAAAGAALMALGMLEAAPVVLAVPCAYALKFLSLVFFIITVIYTAEVFPSKYRNTAVGLCTAVGRIGSISAPLLFELSMDWSDGSFDIFLSTVVIFMSIIAVFAGWCLSIETKGKALAVDAHDTHYGSTKA